MISLNRTLVAAALGCSFVLTSAVAADAAPASAPAKAAVIKKANAGPAGKMTPGAAAVQSVATATALARYGDANKDALALVTAAKMLKDASSKAARAERVSKAPADAAKSDPYSAEAVLTRAKAAAADRPDLQPLLASIEGTAGRGAATGPSRSHTVVNSNATDVYRVTFDAYEPARVYASGDGDSDLDMYVYDENDNLICKDVDNTDDMFCSWTPIRTAKFKIKILNRGVANAYTIITN